MPMSDVDPPHHDALPSNQVPEEPKVLSTAASVHVVNPNRVQREAGYPFLTYAAGGIFEVIGEKGELWLAKNKKILPIR